MKQETYNVTQTGMLTADEKIVELTQIADGQEQEILKLRNELSNIQNNDDTSEFVKYEMETMAEKFKQAENEQNHLREVITQKGACLYFFNQFS